MPKCLLVHKEDDSVSIHYFDFTQKPEGMDDESFIKSKSTEHPMHVDYFKDKFTQIIDSEDLPDRESRDKWMPCTTNGLKIDNEWELKLMPTWIVAKKHFRNLENKMQQAIDAQDFQSYMQANFEWICCKNNPASQDKNNLFWHEKALENLDARVENGESDKKTIRKKLKEKIKELKGE